jgi:hypothetical protein
MRVKTIRAQEIRGKENRRYVTQWTLDNAVTFGISFTLLISCITNPSMSSYADQW